MRKGMKNTDREEIRCFIGVLLFSGMFRSRGEAAECLWDPYMGRPIIAATMSLDRFRTLTATIRFDDRETQPQSNRQAGPHKGHLGGVVGEAAHNVHTWGTYDRRRVADPLQR